MEHVEQRHPTLEDAYGQLLQLEPKLGSLFMAEKHSGEQQKNAFLSGSIRNPHNYYDRLEGTNFEQSLGQIMAAGERMLAHTDLDPKHAGAYQQFIDHYVKKTRLGQLANMYNTAKNAEDKAAAKSEYMQLNVELYAEPVEATYRSLLQEKMQAIDAKVLGYTASQIRAELHEMVDGSIGDTIHERFRPSQETIDWVGDITDSLYSDMVAHVPEQPRFNRVEVRDIFKSIIDTEFGEAAAGWTVDIEPATSINVKTSEKRIVIPEHLGEQSRAALVGLVKHEIGVHMLSAVMGAETDVRPLANGLEGYGDAQEGLGTIMEHGGTYRAATGVDHYITVGSAYFDKRDFRDTFEMKWRLLVLQEAGEGEDVADQAIAKAMNTAYLKTNRIFRGTDELPWFNDLAYFNGSNDMWKYLEEIRGDDLKFMFVLQGKVDPSNTQHQRIQYEARTE